MAWEALHKYVLLASAGHMLSHNLQDLCIPERVDMLSDSIQQCSVYLLIYSDIKDSTINSCYHEYITMNKL